MMISFGFKTVRKDYQFGFKTVRKDYQFGFKTVRKDYHTFTVYNFVVPKFVLQII